VYTHSHTHQIIRIYADYEVLSSNMLPQRPPRAKKRRTAISSSAKEDSTSTLSKSAITTAMAMDGSHDARQPLLGATKASGDDIASVRTSERPLSTPPSHNSDAQQDADMSLQNMSRKSQWIVLAVASGACAAFNGVFAKLYVYDPLLEERRPCFSGFRARCAQCLR
jgi:hypothetical protein